MGIFNPIALISNIPADYTPISISKSDMKNMYLSSFMNDKSLSFKQARSNIQEFSQNTGLGLFWDDGLGY
ncbi:MAG TPA: hypothetical protein PLA94_07000, partial [Myxococcota bacterium]|nr:hypothetical protein [Myxococcota bacterium]